MMPDASALPIAPRRSGIAIWVIGLSLLAFLCYLPFIDSTPLSGTEAHRALPADEMARHGDWLIPHLYGRIYFRKPPLHFWVLATIEKVTGQANSFTWRMGATIPGAMLVGLMCWFGARWFGKVGGIVSGVACISLIAIWAQNRSADIDAGNTLMTALASLSLIELQFGKTRRPGRWIIAASLAVGALLMYKGPAGLPTVGGVLLFILIDAIRRRQVSSAFRRRIWIPIFAGALIFGVYALAAISTLKSRGIPLDSSGLKEGAENLYVESWGRLLEASKLPFLLFAYAMPVSLALPIGLVLYLKKKFDNSDQQAKPDGHDSTAPALVATEIKPESQSQHEVLSYASAKVAQGRTVGVPAGIVAALGWSLVAAWVVCVASGMINPRYGFVTLPLLCPMAGALGQHLWQRRDIEPQRLRSTLIALIVVVLITQLVVTRSVLKIDSRHVYSKYFYAAAAAAVALAIGGAFALLKRRAWQGAWAIVLLFLCVGVPLGYQNAMSRASKSGATVSDALRKAVPPGSEILAGAILRFQPEIFYYAGVKAKAFGETLPDPGQLAGNQWVILKGDEYAAWKAAAAPRMTRLTEFSSNKTPIYLIWLLPPTVPATLPAGAK